MFRTFSKLEVLKEDWPEYVRKAERLLFGEGQREYLERRKAFHKAIWIKKCFLRCVVVSAGAIDGILCVYLFLRSGL